MDVVAQGLVVVDHSRHHCRRLGRLCWRSLLQGRPLHRWVPKSSGESILLGQLDCLFDPQVS